ncbi:MAG: hypothetical protein JHD16_12155 [Solirubrobacteraceae bacterium]|nr:hypothetical protein [Solirubrobacteraceae bacterium]
MCSACALTAMAGATSARAWLATSVPALQHPRRMRAATIALLSAGVLMASVTLTGSTPPPAEASATVTTQR